MTTGLLILMLTLAGARTEAKKRWPDGRWTLKVDQTKTTYVYELEVVIQVKRTQLGYIGPVCWATQQRITGNSWQSVMDQSKGLVSECANAANLRKP